MTQQNNEFEKWATKHIVSKRLLEFNILKYENGNYKSHIMQRKFEAWQAATAEREKRIAELQAHINVLREALIDIAKTNASTHGTTQMMLAHCIKSANEALASTPAQSLQAHDDEVIEKLAQDIARIMVNQDWVTWVVDEIRALKGK